MQQRQAASAYRSRRNSRTSVKEDKLLNALDLEDASRANISVRESTTLVRTQNGTVMSQELSFAAVSRAGEKAIDQSWPVGIDAAADWSIHSEIRSSSLPGHSKADWSAELPTSPRSDRPANFGVVVPGIYRSSYPKPDDYDFVKNLQLKTMVTLVKKDDQDQEFETFLAGNGIRHVVFNIKGTKKEAITLQMMTSILSVVLDRQNHPLMLHCNHGKHRTGCVVAAMRKVSGWDLQRVLNEYELYAAPKLRECDVEYISAFQPPNPPKVGIHELSRFSNPLQARTFLRTLAFSTFVMFLWLASGCSIAANREQ
jgi:tyrosine-protein phosphatase SIW14